ncbi:MAG: response regulator [Deltaproteobacteria bacterium]|nr:response regulator [Deltaproteobacteria bacterium]
MVSGADGTRRRFRILLVDDERSVRTVSAELIRTLGYEVLAAESGQEALELCRQVGGRIDAVLLDVLLPGTSGPELYEALQAVAPSARVVLCSGTHQDPDAQALIASGRADFLEKPYTAVALAEALAEAVRWGEA